MAANAVIPRLYPLPVETVLIPVPRCLEMHQDASGKFHQCSCARDHAGQHWSLDFDEVYGFDDDAVFEQWQMFTKEIQ